MPDRDPAAGAAPSLAARLRQAMAGGGQPSSRDWIVAGVVAGLLWAGPIATIVAANLLAARDRAASTRLIEAAAPRIAAHEAAAQARTALAATLRRPGFAATLEPLARALPKDATLVRMGRGADGALFLDVAAPDPDAVRSALRRASFAQLRDAGQRQAGEGMVASFREEGP